MKLRVGDKAPDFEVVARQAGQARKLSLSEIVASKYLVLYFYPRDFTLVCTREACGFQDAYRELASADTEVVGVSIDDSDTHDRFAREHHLEFALISDPSKELSRRYGATSLMRDVMGVSARITYVIGRTGRIEAIFDSAVSASAHVDGARQTVARLRNASASPRHQAP
jgi:peroxiredoxin Q/BCP